MSTQGFCRAIVVAGVLGLIAGCASVPPVSDRVKQSNPAYANSSKDRRTDDEYDGWLFNSLTGRGKAKPAAATVTPPTDQPLAIPPTLPPPGAPAGVQQNPPGASPLAGGLPAPPPGGTSPVMPASATQPVGLPAAGAQPGGPLVPLSSASGSAPVYITPPGVTLPESSAKSSDYSGFEFSALAPENVWKSLKKSTGYGPDEQIARKAFQEGEALFREKKYVEAESKFKTAAGRWPDSRLEEDAIFLMGECQFFSDRYGSAHDTYGQVLKKHDNSRYLDTIVAREFAIGRYWEQSHQASPHWPVTPNFTDKTRPWFDTFGNALNAYQSVRMFDPTGPLADASVMAAANAYFVQGEYENAAYNYDLLRKEYPTSKYQPQAHVLGLQSKMRIYQGRDYDGVPLDEAEEIAQQSLTQFGNQLGEEKARVAQTAKEIVEKKAERDWAMGQYYEKKRYYGAARFYYVGIVKDYPLTQHAQLAKTRLDQIREKPDVPPNHFKWLIDLIPSEKE